MPWINTASPAQIEMSQLTLHVVEPRLAAFDGRSVGRVDGRGVFEGAALG